MADTGIFATTAEVQRKCGANASATSNVEAYINDFMTQAESFINITCGFNFSDAYSGLNADTKGILKQVASDLAAIKVIQFDMGTFNSLLEAQTMVDILRDSATQALKLLSEAKSVDFINNL